MRIADVRMLLLSCLSCAAFAASALAVQRVAPRLSVLIYAAVALCITMMHSTSVREALPALLSVVGLVALGSDYGANAPQPLAPMQMLSPAEKTV